MHPNLEKVSELSNAELEQKISTLNRYYFMTENDQVKQQIVLVLDDLKLEQENRRIREYQKQSQNNDDNGLDDLINIS
jgi:peptidyl-tRNA hydrolase